MARAASVVMPSKQFPGPSPYIGTKWSKPQAPSNPSSSAKHARSATSVKSIRCWATSIPNRMATTLPNGTGPQPAPGSGRPPYPREMSPRPRRHPAPRPSRPSGPSERRWRQATALTTACLALAVLLPAFAGAARTAGASVAHRSASTSFPGTGVFAFGSAPSLGSTADATVNAPIVGMAATPDGGGYWLVGADLGIFAFGDAVFAGSLGATALGAPIVGIAATPDAKGYWLVGADGGVFCFGDATFAGSLGAAPLSDPIVGMAVAPGGGGYWLVGADGGVFTFGDATFAGSLGAASPAQPIVGIAVTPDGGGYWLAGADGGVFTFGDAAFAGSLATGPVAQPVVGIAASGGGGYWLAEGQSTHSPFTPGVVADVAARPGLVSAAAEDLDTGQVYGYDPGLALDTASIVKVQFLGTVLAEAQSAGRALIPAEQAIAAPMIEVSDNTAASAMLAHVGGPPAVNVFDASVGLTGSSVISNWAFSTTTAADQLILLHHLVNPNPVLSDQSRAYALSLMAQVEPSQAFGVTAGIDPGALRAIKTGRYPSSGVYGSIGWVKGQGRNYLLAVLTQSEPSEQVADATMDEISTSAWATMGH